MNRDERYRLAHREERRLYMIEYRKRKKREARHASMPKYARFLSTIKDKLIARNT